MGEVLGLSRQRVRVLVESRRLPAERNSNGEWVATLQALQDFAAERTMRASSTATMRGTRITPELLLKAYDLLEGGANMRVLVSELRLLPEQIRRIAAEWKAGPHGPIILPRVVRPRGDAEPRETTPIALEPEAPRPVHTELVATALEAAGAAPKRKGGRRRKGA
jgi:hypothetical protein